MSRRRWVAAGLATAALLAGGTAGLVLLLSPGAARPEPGCRVGAGPGALFLSFEQAQNAGTIAAVGEHLSSPERAVTIALATAIRESKLYNLPFGDRDSLGLFQQRPSQGWGTSSQLVDPVYAATAFYDRLVAIPHWWRLPLATAAQEVQHSADGSAYGQFEETGYALARVLTGAVPAGLTCVFDNAVARRPGALRTAATRELGPRQPTTAPAQWARAHWLVSHAYAYGIAEVSVRGQRWTNESGAWHPDERSTAGVPRYVLVRP